MILVGKQIFTRPAMLTNKQEAFSAGRASGIEDSAGEINAERFHEIYERLAPEYGYETRPETRQFKPDTSNGKLMIAVCNEIAQSVRKL